MSNNIYTLTLAPSIDYIVETSNFGMHKVNRATKTTLVPGGKGINVSLVLKNIGVPSVALGFIAGFTGIYIEESLKKLGQQTDFVKVNENDFSRINVKIKDTSCSKEEETELNGLGLSLEDNDLKKLHEKLDKLQSADFLVMSGNSLNWMYADIMQNLKEKKINFIVDTSGESLISAIQQKPFLIKPNHHELSQLFATDISTKEKVFIYGKKLQEMGARNVLVSMGKHGAALITENNNEFFIQAPECKTICTVGAGDSMIAGFLSQWIISHDYEKALKHGVAAGTATAASEGLATKEKIEEILLHL